MEADQPTYETIVKTPIKAGMQLNGKGSNKIKTIGYTYTALIFDSPEKDCQIGSRIIKKVFKNNL